MENYLAWLLIGVDSLSTNFLLTSHIAMIKGRQYLTLYFVKVEKTLDLNLINILEYTPTMLCSLESLFRNI
jgi:hypothetical protein